jgi:hypothetical protein
MYRKLIYIFLLSMGIMSIISFIFVYQANVKLQNDLIILKQAGHLVVPNNHILPTLKQFLPALCSSLFISLTAGIFLSLIICLFVLFFFSYRKDRRKNFHIYTYAILITLSAIILTGAFVADRSIFHRIRDYALLPHPAGLFLNNFYYTYSPYAANAIAPSIEKQFKICWMAPDIPDRKHLIDIAAKYGWLAMRNKEQAAFTIEISKDHQFILKNKGKSFITVKSDNFLKDPDHFLKSYFQKSDYARYIRIMCLAGLVAGLPVCLFLLLFSAFVFFTKKFIPNTWAIFASCTVIYILIAGCLLFLYPLSEPGTEVSKEMLNSENSRSRIEALRKLYRNDRSLEIHYNTQLGSTSIPERYWIAKNLSKANSPQSLQMLKKMLKDESVIVTTAAIKSLDTKCCDPDTIGILDELITNSPHWYVQIAAYNAVRKCHP